MATLEQRAKKYFLGFEQAPIELPESPPHDGWRRFDNGPVTITTSRKVHHFSAVEFWGREALNDQNPEKYRPINPVMRRRALALKHRIRKMSDEIDAEMKKRGKAAGKKK